MSQDKSGYVESIDQADLLAHCRRYLIRAIADDQEHDIATQIAGTRNGVPVIHSAFFTAFSVHPKEAIRSTGKNGMGETWEREKFIDTVTTLSHGGFTRETLDALVETIERYAPDQVEFYKVGELHAIWTPEFMVAFTFATSPYVG